MSSAAEQHLMAELRDGIDRLKREIGYNPTYFIGMVADLGPAEACRRLIRSAKPSDGFATLWEASRLDMTVEALSLLPWYGELFDDQDSALARRRLEAHGFDVEAFLRRRTAVEPSWVSAHAPTGGTRERR